MGELLIFGEYVGFDGAGVVGPEDSAKSDESCSVVRPGGSAGAWLSSDGTEAGAGTGAGLVVGGGVEGRRPSEGRLMSTA